MDIKNISTYEILGDNYNCKKCSTNFIDFKSKSKSKPKSKPKSKSKQKSKPIKSMNKILIISIIVIYVLFFNNYLSNYNNIIVELKFFLKNKFNFFKYKK